LQNGKTPLPSTTRYARVHVPQGGEAKTILKLRLLLETQHAIRRRKEANSIPSPFGEGQMDMPINLANQGEVASALATR
jgi:hypothetical protein